MTTALDLEPDARSRQGRGAFAVCAAVTLVLDLATKAWVFHDASGRTGGELLRALAVRWADWSLVEPRINRGVAWSMLDGLPGLVVGLTVVLVPVLILIYWRGYRRSPRLVEHLAFGAIIGGALGNAFDRLWGLLPGAAVDGVRDFIHVDLRLVGIPYTWPTFNLADSGITVGFVLLVVAGWLAPRAPAAPSDRHAGGEDG